MRVEVFKQVVRSMVRHKIRTPLVAVGVAGIGKTESVKNVASELNIPCSVLRLGSMQDVGDLLGMMQVTKFSDGTEVSVYAPPSWYKTIQNGGILFMDELNRTKPQLQDAAMQLLDQGKFNDFVLPENVIIIGAMNPSTDEYDVNEQDIALVDRFVAVPVRNEVDDVLSFAISNNWDSDVLDLIAYGGHDLVLNGKIKLPPKKFTARGLRQLNDFMPVIREVPDASVDIVVGCVGPDGFEKWKFREIFKKVPTAAQYFANPDKYNVKSFELPEQMVLISRIVKHIVDKKQVTNDDKKVFTNFCVQLSDPVFSTLLRIASSSDETGRKVCRAIDWIADKNLHAKASKILGLINSK